MAFTNFESKEIHCKVIYVGASQAGKSENFRSLHHLTTQDPKLKRIGLERSSTVYYDFLPISVGQVAGFNLKLHLYTMPAPALYPSTCSVILKGMDAVVQVIDSQVNAYCENERAWQQFRQAAEREGYSVRELPRVIQYNKRDYSDILDLQVLKLAYNGSMVPEFESVAVEHKGTLECLQSLTRQLLRQLSGETLG